MSSILAEPASEVTSGFSRGGSIDLSGEFLHLSPKDRKRAKLKAKARAERWKLAAAVRETWGPEEFAKEAQRLEAEKQAILADRHAA
jgi:hypothetical protein